MPFTISHAAAVLPFSRHLARWRLLSATVIGSMVPDFGLLMPWQPDRAETHSAIGLLTFCLPVGLATFWVYQRLIKHAMIEVLPDAAHRRWRGFDTPADPGSLRQWGLAAVGVLVGAVTHLVWDGFTHEGARGVRMIPSLDDPAVDIAGHHIAGPRLLQDVSSLLGLAVVVAIVLYGLRSEPHAAPLDRALSARERRGWLASYVGVTLALAASFLLVRRSYAPPHSLSVIVGNYAIAALRGSAAALMLVSMALVMRLRANRSSTVRA